MIDDPRDPTADTQDDTEFSNEHPLASPTELAGTTEHAIEAEFAARDALAAEEDTLPLDGN